MVLFIVLDLFVLIVLGLAAYRIWFDLSRWQRGRPEDRSDQMGDRLRGLWIDAGLQRRIRIRLGRGLAHFSMAWGVVLLALSMVIIGIQENFSVPFLMGDFSRYFHLVVDIIGIAAIAGTLGLGSRRFISQPAGLDTRWNDGVALVAIFLVLVSGFGIEGARIASVRAGGDWKVPVDFALTMPAGLVASEILRLLGLSSDTYLAIYDVSRWIHGFLGYSLVGLIGLTKLSHVVEAPLNVLYRRLEPMGRLTPVDFEAGTFGLETSTDLSWKHRLDLDACLRCGRCQEVCPAFNTGKPLSPKALIQDLRLATLQEGGDPSLGAAILGRLRRTPQAPPAAAGGSGVPLAGSAIAEDTIWACTTCAACMAICPIHIEHVPKIMGLRRQLVLAQQQMPETAAAALHNLELRGHPWTGSPFNRTDWMKGLDIPLMMENPDVDILFWVGCSGALVERNQTSTIALAKILQAAGVKFGVLGDEEFCTGDAARRLGAEHYFQMYVEQNLDTFRRYNVKKILTQCAHCFNTLKNEYPQYGGEFEVIHHTEFLAQLLREGKLKPTKPLDEILTYHDPCYLGRYNGVYEQPREALEGIGGWVADMPRNRSLSFCCGSGGGHAWTGDKIGKKINLERTEEALATGSEVIVTSCPFCMQMFEDGLKGAGAEERTRVVDISEVIAKTL